MYLNIQKKANERKKNLVNKVLSIILVNCMLTNYFNHSFLFSHHRRCQSRTRFAITWQHRHDVTGKWAQHHIIAHVINNHYVITRYAHYVTGENILHIGYSNMKLFVLIAFILNSLLIRIDQRYNSLLTLLTYLKSLQNIFYE